MELEILLKILLAAVLGGIVGLERELSHKDGALHTNILIAVGSALMTLLSFEMAETWKSADPARVVAQVVVGMGILGAGVIIKERFMVQGLTKAATIWTVAGIGMAVGMGYYLTAFAITLMVALILWVLKFVASILESQHALYPYIISTEDRAAVLLVIKKILTELGIKYHDAKMRKTDEGYEIEISLLTSKNKNQSFLEKVMQVPGVKEVVSEHL